ncbi:Hypothetical predicted protein, partial [Lynx pardinus]
MIEGTLISVLLLTSYGLISIASNPHIPYTLTWEVSNLETQEVYNTTTADDTPLNAWWPDLYFNLEDVAVTMGVLPPNGSRQRPNPSWTGTPENEKKRIRSGGFYACPGFRTGAMKKTCGGIESLYCKAWSCVTTNDGSWKWEVKPHYIDMKFASPCPKQTRACNLIRIKFLEDGKKETRWITGLNWGIYLYRGPPYFATVIQIRLKIKPKASPTLTGPNQSVWPTSKPNTTPRSTNKGTNPPATQVVTVTGTTPRKPPKIQTPFKDDPLWVMMNTTYKALNHTKPNETEACWLCYSTKPPFYESVAIVGNYSTANNSDTCSWGQRRPGLTLPVLMGNGTCIGTVPTKYSHLCISNRNIFNTSENWIIPPNNSWWLCSYAGLTP